MLNLTKIKTIISNIYKKIKCKHLKKINIICFLFWYLCIKTSIYVKN